MAGPAASSIRPRAIAATSRRPRCSANRGCCRRCWDCGSRRPIPGCRPSGSGPSRAGAAPPASSLSYKEIARQLDRSVSTIDHQTRRLREKFGVHSNARLMPLLDRLA
ncbi:hypothetical protein EWH46_18975 (plasmid) [Sphaerotilus sulfidivorans]|uniref:Uncharacterized protein n=1 Tax=Sphaerotilus sulfidivorans TaxID=639200 RepID=A0A5C1Q4A1_9BURK|nr:hypothetical protein [Sphaerotilus sulfidivorans]QEN02943.1 hypothetical protein EWH46_18975 [Sphaerotilus sulfidivorans]